MLSESVRRVSMRPGVLLGCALLALSSQAAWCDPAAEMPSPGPSSVPDIDIVGLKLGMSPTQVQALLSNLHTASTKVFRHTLTYADPLSGKTRELPGSDYLRAIVAWTGTTMPSSSDDWEEIGIVFTPEAGRERAGEIVRVVNYSQAHTLSAERLGASLKEKYGVPWMSGFYYPSNVSRWNYLPSGVAGPRKCGSAFHWDPVAASSAGFITQLTSGAHPTLSVGLPTDDILGNSPVALRDEAKCTSAQVVASYQIANPSAPEAQRVANRLVVAAIATGISFDAIAKTVERVQSAIDGANEAARDKAGGNKPVL